MALLDVRDIEVRFGGVVALDGLSFTAEANQICALIGPNGAGKTTLFNVVSRLYEANAGHVTFDGRRSQDEALAAILAFLDHTFPNQTGPRSDE